MVVIDIIADKWVVTIGGAEVVYNLLAAIFVFMIVYIFYKISV